MLNYHVHSDISFDCDAPMQVMAQAARSAGVQICFTEHIDISDWRSKGYIPDLDAYNKEFNRLKSLGYDISKGAEVCFPARDFSLEYKKYMSGWDFVILSQHYVNGIDPYEKAYFQNKPLKEAVLDYFLEVRETVKRYDGFSVVGHIGYVSKYAPSKVDFLEYMDVIDDILKIALQKGCGIEINTATLDITGQTMPPLSVAKRYLDMGGEIITLGSDAHTPQRISYGLEQTLGQLKSIGFKYVCRYKSMSPEFVKIEDLI